MSAAATGLLAAAMPLIDHLVVTDREQVYQNVVGVVRAFEAGDAPRTLGYFDADASCERALVTFALNAIKAPDPLSLKDISIEQSTDHQALSYFRVNGSVQFGGRSTGHQATMWLASWEKKNGEWKILRIKQLDPLSGEPMDQLARLGFVLCQ